MASRLVVLILLGLTAPVQMALAPPQATPGTLSFIDDTHVEIRYQTRDEVLTPATFVQTLGAVALAASIPPTPLNPWLVENGLETLGIPHRRYRSCWPGDGVILLLPTAPMGAVDAALAAAGAYYDSAHEAREFEAAYWAGLFAQQESAPAAPPGWPGEPTMETLKETIVGSLPLPANLDSMDTYARRGVVPFLQIHGEYVPVCFIFCLWLPKCLVSFSPTDEGYGILGAK